MTVSTKETSAAPSGSAALQRLAAIVGDARVLTDPQESEPFQRDWRGRYRGAAQAIVFPGSTQEVCSVVQACAAMDIAVVPQGGNTGLTGGAVAGEHRPSIILNLSRMSRIRDIDARNNSMVVEAGCILANVREVADQSGRQFPMLLGSVGSCQIGGLVSTNAGGTGVLRYGNMRELVLGLEVVLPDGSLWDGLRSLRKDNSGYDLKQLFIGAEGTLGVVTAISLKLFPKLAASATAMVAVPGVQSAVDLLRFLQERIGQRIEAFEIMSRRQLELVMEFGPGLQSPMGAISPWYVLIEIADSPAQWNAGLELEEALGAAMERDLISDAVVASDIAKADRIWALRHHISESNKRAGFTISNDTSVPVSSLPVFIDRVTRRVEAEIDGAQLCHVGHIGDGNIHVICVLPRETYDTPEKCETEASKVNLIVHAVSVELGGSISAEHGIGRMHVSRLEMFKPEIDLWMMRTLKAAFDPFHLMNPGTILQANSRSD
ncbi:MULTISPECIES: FAD-binding oxidoreductase [unclassified Acidovorax]|uniref:FAD-binding oxidoreductase n=1 Tax=unclassified Acidovorax TaxID=2684926 RepID=UPI001C44907A|nr:MULTISPECIES: FAD-binding oxidoreductase [unclassified Acidovorax]MBV7431661.1 FAD-binding oxidoreductase [Acidovorax sp. sif0732]MBV7452785.1 FAD-binding oxidoreductase [Acidovorax sp. sif0715]